jgi:molybdate transport system substrate-binding protein
MSVTPTTWAFSALAALTVLAQPTVVRAAEIRVLCSGGLRAVMEELLPQFEQASHHSVIVRFAPSVVLKRQIEAGEPFDLAILTPPLIDDLITQGRIAGDSRTTLARSGMALAIRAGAARPDIRSTAALERTLLAARSIGYVRDGAGGLYFAELIKRLDLADALRSRITIVAATEELTTSVARGEIELGVLPMSEILPVAGVAVLGTFPADVQSYLVNMAGVSLGASQGAAARDLIRFLTSPAALPVIKKKGMEPGR